MVNSNPLMVDFKTQQSINIKFVNIYIATINKYNIDTNHLIKKLEEYEKKNINDTSVTNLIKNMLDVPYYENLKPVNSLRKFKLLQEKLKTIHHELMDITIRKRLQELRKPHTTTTKKKSKLLQPLI
jgi:hypothetical protein